MSLIESRARDSELRVSFWQERRLYGFSLVNMSALISGLTRIGADDDKNEVAVKKQRRRRCKERLAKIKATLSGFGFDLKTHPFQGILSREDIHQCSPSNQLHKGPHPHSVPLTSVIEAIDQINPSQSTSKISIVTKYAITVKFLYLYIYIEFPNRIRFSKSTFKGL